MAPYYELVCKELGWNQDAALLTQMKGNNEKKLKEIDEQIADAEKNLGSTEVREAYFAKFNYLCRIGNKVTYRIYLTSFRRSIDWSID